MATVPTAPTFGSELSSSDKFNQLRDAAAFALNPPRARLRPLGTTNLATSGTWTTIAFDGHDFDSVPGHDDVTNNSRYTFNYAGTWEVFGALAFAANTTGDRGTRWAVNGTTLSGSQIIVRATSGAVIQPIPARTIQVQVSVGDYIEMQGWQTSGGALLTSTGGSSDVSSTLEVRWVSS